MTTVCQLDICVGYYHCHIQLQLMNLDLEHTELCSSTSSEVRHVLEDVNKSTYDYDDVK